MGIGPFYSYVVIGIILLVAAIVIYRLVGFKPGQIGLTLGKYLPLQLVIALAGVGLGFIEYLILRPEPLVETYRLQSILTSPGADGSWVSWEELIFRASDASAPTGIYNGLPFRYLPVVCGAAHRLQIMARA